MPLRGVHGAPRPVRPSSRVRDAAMIVATTPFIAGHRSLGGGEIKEYTSLLEDTRRQALDRLVQNATMMGGNAVISMRFDSSEMATTMTEIVAYGTAVVIEADASAAQTAE